METPEELAAIAEESNAEEIRKAARKESLYDMLAKLPKDIQEKIRAEAQRQGVPFGTKSYGLEKYPIFQPRKPRTDLENLKSVDFGR